MKTLPMASAIAFAVSGMLFGQSRIGQHVFTTQDLSSGDNYWTPQRRAAAKPRETSVFPQGAEPLRTAVPEQTLIVPGAAPSTRLTASKTNEQLSAGTAENGVEELAAAEPLQNAVYPHPYSRYEVLNVVKNIYPYSAVGKLFFTIPGIGDFVCSASVIRPHLLLTARHCVYDWPSQTWATNVEFYPGYFNGPNNTLGGAWRGRALITWTGAGNSPQLGEWDIGIIQTFRKNGGQCKPDATHRQIESYTGVLGYQVGGNFNERHWDDFGYPANYPFEGETPYQCEAGTGKLNGPGFPNTVEIGCDQTGGTSGGPWLGRFRPGATGNANLAGSLNSFRFTSQPYALNGPQFLQSNFKKLLDSAVALACP